MWSVSGVSKSDNNSIAELVDLSARLVKGSDDDGQSLNVELRVHPHSVYGPNDLCISVAIKRLLLNLDLNGLEIVPGTRYGEPTKDNVAVREFTHVTEVSEEATGSGEAAIKISPIGTPEVSTTGRASGSIAAKEALSYKDTRTFSRVRALGNMRWEVAEPPWEIQKLDLTYIPDKTLCRLSVKDRANQKSLEIKATVRQRDLDLEADRASRLLPFRTPNQKKLLKIVIAKALSTEGEYNGLITFSKSAIEIED